jgi:Outer membrane protein beta-barrel domain
MKNPFIITLLCLSLIGTIATAQTKKPTTTTTKKPSTTVKSTAPKTTTKTSTTTTTIPNSTTAPVVVEEKKPTTTTSPTQSNPSSVNSNNSSGSTTIQQSSGPSKGGKKPAETKPEKVKEPKPERVREPKPERVREPRPEKVRNPSNSSDGGVRFGIRAEATQAVTLESGGSYDLSPGVNAGLIVNLPISSTVSIQPEILYSMTVGKISQDANNYAKGTSGSILVPLMVNINLGQGSTKFMLNLGGYADYLLSQNSKLVVGGVTKLDGSLDLTNADKFDYGAAIGIGVKINGNFMIEARSFYGLKDNTGKNGIGTIGIGYFF